MLDHQMGENNLSRKTYIFYLDTYLLVHATVYGMMILDIDFAY